MKNRLFVSLAVTVFLFGALAFAGDQDKDKTKTTPPPKQTVTAKQKPAAVAQPKPSAAPQHGPAPTVQPKPATAMPHGPAPAPQPKPVGHPTESNVRVSSPGNPNPGGQGVQRGQQGQPGHPVFRHVDTKELHQRMSAPVSREVIIRDRDHYHQAELVRFKVRGPVFRFEPRHRVVLVGLRIVPATYFHRRVVFYETFGYVPPVYIFSLRPSYGLWCATFLAFMLDRIALENQLEYSLMYYNHMNEPEFIEWRSEMNGLAAENAELRAKLAALDERVARLEGTPRNPGYVPEEAGDVAVAPQVIDKLTSGPEK